MTDIREILRELRQEIRAERRRQDAVLRRLERQLDEAEASEKPQAIDPEAVIEAISRAGLG